jgi:hypothetical protein
MSSKKQFLSTEAFYHAIFQPQLHFPHGFSSWVCGHGIGKMLQFKENY